MKSIILILLVITVVVVANHHKCSINNRDDLLTCFDRFIDTDHDGKITKEELETMFTDHKPCFPKNVQRSEKYFEIYSPAFIMKQCDADKNGHLDSVDWNHKDACLKHQTIYNYVCKLCGECEHHHNKKKVEKKEEKKVEEKKKKKPKK